MKRKSSALPIAIGLAVLLAAGLLLVLQTSFAPGNIYAPYSTLRTDPLGSSVLLESLQALPGQKVSQNFRPLPKLAPQAGSTFIALGGELDDVIMQSPQNFTTFEEQFAAGSRFVIICAPVVEDIPTWHKKDESAETSAKKETKPGEDKIKAVPLPEKESEKTKNHPNAQLISLCEKWGFALAIIPLPEKTDNISGDKKPAAEALPTNTSGFDRPLLWSSFLAFRHLDPAWHVLYEKEGHPVLIERSYGKGSIVLGTDPYFMSNEALRSDRRTGLILRILGSGRPLVFDETQHGLYKKTSMADLLRRYRLQGTLACLTLLAGLFVWRSMLSLIPASESSEIEMKTSLGPTAREGMVHLLRRNLSPLQAFQEAMNRWLKVCGKGSTEENRIKAHDYLFDLRLDKKRSRDISGIYKTLQTMMTERK